MDLHVLQKKLLATRLVGLLICCGFNLLNANSLSASTITDATSISDHINLPLDCANLANNCQTVGEFEFALSAGLGIRTNPLHDSSSIPLILLPEWRYYGERFFIENLELGYTLGETQSYQFNLLVSPSYDRVFFNRWDLGNLFVDFSASEVPPGEAASDAEVQPTFVTEINPDDVSNRRFSLLGGIEYSAAFDQHIWQLSLLTDISGIHSGTELRAAYAYQLTEKTTLTTGFTWKSALLTDYYYGVDADEVDDDRGLYQANASVNPFIRLSWASAQKGWRLAIDYQRLDSEITQSPLVKEQQVISVFFGKRFHLF